MAEIIWTQPALNDLNDIAEYIALSNPTAAKDLVQKVFERVDLLEQQPESGRIPRELQSFKYREVVVNPCRMFYKIEAQKLYILFIMRQEQDLKRFFLTTQKV